MKRTKNKCIVFRGGNIAFNDEGKGRVLVVLHGFLGSKELFSNWVKDLTSVYRVVSIDLPGHGESDSYGYVHSMNFMARSVKAVLDHLRLKRYVILGHSMGGYVALAYGELFPEHLKGIVMLHSTSFADGNLKKSDRDKAITSVKKNKEYYIRATIKNLFSPLFHKTRLEEIRFATKIATHTSKRGIICALEGMKERPSRDIILTYAGYPVMFVIGRYDAVLPMQTLLDQAQMVEQKYVLFLEKAGHMAFLEEPGCLSKHVKKYLRAVFSKDLKGMKNLPEKVIH